MIDVTCAIIIWNGKILATLRARGMHLEGHWEFPGGKIETGETAEACISREILEELNIRIRVIRSMQPVEHHYPNKAIRLIPFVCEIVSGKIQLAEHSEFRWLDENEIHEMNWAAADRKVVEGLINMDVKDKNQEC
ncbi:MAG: (deoxy)nucleoside triphosphate pyrophosphohydrolase [Bacteroidales bacterium]